VSRSGEREAEFTAFVEAGSASLLRAALVLLDTREEAEDAVQTVLLRTFRRWEQAKQAPEAYSRTVLVNVCQERWRYRGRHPEAPGILAYGAILLSRVNGTGIRWSGLDPLRLGARAPWRSSARRPR
jgi:DNA-directed RNA polymerase specialized sigma24 family protein